MLMLLTLVIFLVCVFVGVPIFYAFGLTATFACIIMDIPLQVIAQRLMIGMDSFLLLAVPGFILAGEIMCQGGISKRIVDFSQSLVGHLKGGLSLVTVMTGMIIGGIAGSAIAETAATASILVPELEKEHYPKEFSAALVGTAGPVGNIIPPSIPMVVYSMVSGISLLDLLLAGYLPGLIIGLSLMLYCWYISKKRNYGRDTVKFSFKTLWIGFKRSILAIMIPVVVVGGIVSGIFTPTESAIICVIYSLLIAIYVYHETTWAALPKLLTETAKATAKLVIIMGAGAVFSYISINEGIPEMFTKFMLNISDNKYVILLVLNIIFLFAGCLIDILVATIIFVPVLIPLEIALGLDPLHVAMIFIINLSIGLLTPPVGYSLYVASAISGVSVDQVARYSMPFVLIMLVILGLMTVFPQLSLFVPGLFH